MAQMRLSQLTAKAETLGDAKGRPMDIKAVRMLQLINELNLNSAIISIDDKGSIMKDNQELITAKGQIHPKAINMESLSLIEGPIGHIPVISRTGIGLEFVPNNGLVSYKSQGVTIKYKNCAYSTEKGVTSINLVPGMTEIEVKGSEASIPYGLHVRGAGIDSLSDTVKIELKDGLKASYDKYTKTVSLSALMSINEGQSLVSDMVAGEYKIKSSTGQEYIKFDKGLVVGNDQVSDQPLYRFPKEKPQATHTTLGVQCDNGVPQLYFTNVEDMLKQIPGYGPGKTLKTDKDGNIMWTKTGGSGK